MHRALALLFAVLPLAAQDLLPPEVLLLSRIRARVQQAVDRLPDCMCVETVSRYHKATGKELKFMDNVVFQVLFSGDKELFASPGDTHWEKTPFSFVSGGMLGTGLFALHLRSVFLDNQSLIKYHGMEEPGGRSEARYDFSISRMLSGYTIHRGSVSAVAGIHGSFWADPETHDVRRLEIHADDLPLELLYADVFTAISYERVRVGETEQLLPQSADLRTVGIDGEESRDIIEFTHCQGFHTESTLSFETPASAEATAPTPRQTTTQEGILPPELRVTIALTSGLDSHAGVGSLVEGKSVDNVVQKGKVLAPAGAPVRGRVRRLEHYDDNGGYFIVALEFTTIQTPAQNLRFYAGLLDLDRPEGVETVLTVDRRSGDTAQFRTRISAPDLPGVGTFFVRGPRFLLPPGFKSVWKTRLYPSRSSQQ
jgi:hypothetical protein